MLQLMILKQMPLDKISFENQAFRISEGLDSEPVLNSIREVGQLNPVILLDLQPQMAIVCGFRRLHALKQLDRTEVLAWILSTEDHSTSAAFLLALWDNLSHRQLSPLEKARTLFKLKDMCGMPNEELVRIYLPVLGLAPNENVLHSHLLLNGLHQDLRRCLAEGKLTQHSAEFLAEMQVPVQTSIAALMNRVRWSASLQKKALQLLDELRTADGSTLDAPLKRPQVRAILEDAGLSPFQKGDKVYEILYRRQHPRLSQAEDRFLAHKKKLALPGSIQIDAHPFFEEPGLRVEFHASGIDRFRQLAAALHAAAQSPDIERLFDLD
jgi:ParB-like chromosome segregation protein Spo0J